MTGIGHELEARHWEHAPDAVGSSLAPAADAPLQPAAELQYTPQQLVQMAIDLEPFTGREISRRAALRLLRATCVLAGTSAVLHAVEQPIMDGVYEQHDTKLIFSGVNVSHPVHHAGLASQGWGITQSESIIHALLKEDVYKESFPFAGIRCSSKGVTDQSFERCGQQFVDVLNPQEADIHAVSEGLMIALTTARAAKRHVRMISSYDSPNDINDAYHSFLAKGIALADELGVYHGGIFGKLTAVMGEQIDQHGFPQLATGWLQAFHSTFTGGDPRMMVSQLSFMYRTNILREWRSFRSIIDKDTQAYILRTRRAATDKVTKDIQAEDKLAETYHNLGASVVEIEVDTPGHADTYAGIATAAPHYKNFLEAA